MRRTIFYCFFITLSLYTQAQTKPTDLDKSPMDMSYFPSNFPILKMKGQAAQEPSIRVIYSRPQKKNRDIFGGEVRYNEVWRLGANETTEIEFFRNAKIGNKKILKGRYSLFCIPTQNKWTVILNKDVYSWGSFTYKSEKDVARVDVPTQKSTESVEAFTMYFEPAKDGAQLIVLWDDVRVSVPISF
jgi:hypothetical protein